MKIVIHFCLLLISTTVVFYFARMQGSGLFLNKVSCGAPYGFPFNFIGMSGRSPDGSYFPCAPTPGFNTPAFLLNVGIYYAIFLLFVTFIKKLIRALRKR